MLKSDAKGSGGGNHMLLGCMCLTANTVSMVRKPSGQSSPIMQQDTQSGDLSNSFYALIWTDGSAFYLFVQALYYILAKHLVGKYNPVCIAAWAYIVAASLMGATAAATVQRNEWTVPTAMLGPLLYWYSCLRLPTLCHLRCTNDWALHKQRWPLQSMPPMFSCAMCTAGSASPAYWATIY